MASERGILDGQWDGTAGLIQASKRCNGWWARRWPWFSWM
jgi:hypothetical protein